MVRNISTLLIITVIITGIFIINIKELTVYLLKLSQTISSFYQTLFVKLRSKLILQKKLMICRYSCTNSRVFKITIYSEILFISSRLKQRLYVWFTVML